MMNLPFTLKPDQANALHAVHHFLQDPAADVFVLRGSAGTGKTTLIPALLNTAIGLGIRIAMLSPTGRAARIMQTKVVNAFSANTDAVLPALTLHKFLYCLRRMHCGEGVDDDERLIDLLFTTREDIPDVDLVIIDEASMVGDTAMWQEGMQFGSGRLLTDLLSSLRADDVDRAANLAVKVIMVGDPAQLPPVGSNISPALERGYLTDMFGLNVSGYDLTEVVRQQSDSDLLAAAVALRDQIVDGVPNSRPLRENHRDIVQKDFQQAVSLIAESVWKNTSMVAVARTNERVHQYNQAVRQALGRPQSEPLSQGERLLVLRNNNASGYQNGDLLHVHWVAESPEVVCIPYLDTSVRLVFRWASVGLFHQGQVLDAQECYLLENTLHLQDAGLPEVEAWALLQFFTQRHPDFNPNSLQWSEARDQDPYLNALIIKHGYAMTCHKAQGGEWESVIVDFSGGGVQSLNRWIYTAITRASQKLFLVNPPYW